MIDRRRLLTALGTCAAAMPLLAAGLPRIGVLSVGSAPSGGLSDPETGLRQGLAQLGYLEGRNVAIDWRYAEGRSERLPALAAELVRLHSDVILAGGPAPRRAAMEATGSIPIVTISGSDPVGEGWAKSLARPGGNVTGLTVTFPELSAKRLEILKETFPALDRVAVLRDPGEVPSVVDGQIAAGAHRLGLEILTLDFSGAADAEAAFALATQRRAQALLAIATNTVVTHRARLAGLAILHRLPSMGEFPLLAQAGFLMSYGADLDALGRGAATMIDRILKGARVGELPIERPTKFQLVVNRGTGRAMALTLPQTLLLRADEVIE